MLLHAVEYRVVEEMDRATTRLNKSKAVSVVSLSSSLLVVVEEMDRATTRLNKSKAVSVRRSIDRSPPTTTRRRAAHPNASHPPPPTHTHTHTPHSPQTH